MLSRTTSFGAWSRTSIPLQDEVDRVLDVLNSKAVLSDEEQLLTVDMLTLWQIGPEAFWMLDYRGEPYVVGGSGKAPDG